jgi:hypothetical protein
MTVYPFEVKMMVHFAEAKITVHPIKIKIMFIEAKRTVRPAEVKMIINPAR